MMKNYLVVIAEDIPLSSLRYNSRHKEYIDVRAQNKDEANRLACFEARNHRKFFADPDVKMVVERCLEKGGG